jgi:hypothetical protein
VTEAEARAALRAFVGIGDVEPWIAEQRWEPIPDGWRVRESYQGWRFRLEPVASGLRVVMSARRRAGGVVRAGLAPVSS